MNCGRLHELRNRSDSKIGSKKPAHPRRLVQETGTKSVPNNLTNQYLWDLDCGLRASASPVRKRKGINGNATSCVNYPLLLQVQAKQKNLRISTQVGVIRVINNDVDSTYQYLWDHHSISLTRWPASRQSQQRFANCNERFVLSLYRRISPVQVTFARHGGARGLNRRSFSVKLA